MDLIKVAEQAFLVENNHPAFKAGDTVTVAYRIKEGNKERIQEFRGDVIRPPARRKNAFPDKTMNG